MDFQVLQIRKGTVFTLETRAMPALRHGETVILQEPFTLSLSEHRAGSEQKYGVLIDVSGPKPLLGFEFLRRRLIEGVKEAGIIQRFKFS